jgi:hypothetical protein
MIAPFIAVVNNVHRRKIFPFFSILISNNEQQSFVQCVRFHGQYSEMSEELIILIHRAMY